jgi:proteasome accessory factor C
MSAYRQIITEVVAMVEEMAQPLTLRELSEALSVPCGEIRRQVVAFDSGDDGIDYDGTRPAVFIDPAGDEWGDYGPSDDDRVKVVGAAMRERLGVERFDASVLAPLYQAAAALAEQEPQNTELASAAEGLLTQFLPGLRRRDPFRAELIGQLGRAISENGRVRIRYSRAWKPGVFSRTVEPYRIVHTRRGAELDAGPPAADGTIRTYLVSRIYRVEVLDSTFVRPGDAEERCDAARVLTTVRGQVPIERLWVIERAAEETRTWNLEPGIVAFEADLLPPVAWRAGRMMAVAGAGARLEDPALAAGAAQIARELWDHHGLDHPAA